MEVIKKTISKLKERNGSASISTAIYILVAFMIFSVVCEICYVLITLQGVRDITSQAVVSTATNNSYNAFVGVKEGNTYSMVVDTSDVKNKLSEMFKLTSELESYSGKTLKFKMENLNVEFDNAEKSTTDNSITLNFTTTVDVIVPLRIVGETFSIRKPIKVKSSYTPLF